jgi:AbrB family looped-hinge helix DNA binding protein
VLRKTTRLSKCDSVGSPALRAADSEYQFTAAAFQLGGVPHRLMVILEPAPVTTTPSHVLLQATGTWRRKGSPSRSRFGSIERILTADVAALAGVRGIGARKTAARIRELIRRTDAPGPDVRRSTDRRARSPSSYRCSKIASMTTTTVSSKGQIVIPRHLREKHRLTSGVRLQITETDEGLILSRIKRASRSGRQSGWRALRGSVKGTDALKEHLEEHRHEAKR